MKVLEIGFDVEISFACTVVYHEPPQWFEQVLNAIKSSAKPFPLPSILEIDPPRFVHDGLQHDTGVIPISNQNLPEHPVSKDRGHSGEVVGRKPGVAPRRKFRPN